MGRPKTIADEMLADVRAGVAARRGATMQKLCDDFASRTGLEVCTVTLHRAIKRAGLERKTTREKRATRSPSGTATPTRIARPRPTRIATPVR